MTDIWLFFDLGSTLVDEADCYRKRFGEMAEESGRTPQELEEMVIEFSRRNRKGDHEAAKILQIPIPKWHKELEKLYPDAREVVEALHARGYKLGIIANQSAGTCERLEKWGILRKFDVILASAEEGIAIPDPAIFSRALERSGCAPAHAVMIGDRLDNDIAPAKQLGWQTVWVKQGYGGYAEPALEQEEPHRIVRNLTELLDIFR